MIEDVISTRLVVPERQLWLEIGAEINSGPRNRVKAVGKWK